MYKLFFVFVLVVVSCKGKKTTTENIEVATDSLMDSTTIKMKADTTVKRLDNLEDSIKKLRDKAAEQN
ncbi:MAG: hypothetical protein ABIO05_04995 [Ferruginibacter sp.]